MAVVELLAAGPACLASGGPLAEFWDSPWPWILFAAIAVLALALLGAFTRYLRISLRLFLNTDMPLTAGLGSEAKLAGDVHEFPSRDGASLKGVFIDPPAGVPVRGTIVFAHEFKGDRNSAAQYAAGLPEAGWRIFALDFRGHGESPKEPAYRPTHWVTDFEVNDLLGAVAYVESTAARPDHLVGIMGVSRGACTAAIASLHTTKIRFLIVDGVFSTDLMVEGLMKRWAAIFASINLVKANQRTEVFSILRAFTVLYAELKLRCRYPLVRRALSRLRDVPVFFIYGQSDAYIVPEHRIALYRVKPGAKQLWEVPDAKHNQAVSVARAEYGARVTAFLDKFVPAGGSWRGGPRRVAQP